VNKCLCVTGQRILKENLTAEVSASNDAAYKTLRSESVEQYLGLAVQQFRDLMHLHPAENSFLGLHPCPFATHGDWNASEAPGAGGSGTKNCFGGVFVVSPADDVVSLWELDLLMRERFSQLISETDQSIRSLLQLVCLPSPG
jgi:hypothetical protein